MKKPQANLRSWVTQQKKLSWNGHWHPLGCSLRRRRLHRLRSELILHLPLQFLQISPSPTTQQQRVRIPNVVGLSWEGAALDFPSWWAILQGKAPPSPAPTSATDGWRAPRELEPTRLEKHLQGVLQHSLNNLSLHSCCILQHPISVLQCLSLRVLHREQGAKPKWISVGVLGGWYQLWEPKEVLGKKD